MLLRWTGSRCSTQPQSKAAPSAWAMLHAVLFRSASKMMIHHRCITLWRARLVSCIRSKGCTDQRAAALLPLSLSRKFHGCIHKEASQCCHASIGFRCTKHSNARSLPALGKGRDDKVGKNSLAIRARHKRRAIIMKTIYKPYMYMVL